MRFARWLLTCVVPVEWRESIVGDLEEERRQRMAAGRTAGPVWAVTAAFVTAVKLGLEGGRHVVPVAARGSFRLGVLLMESRLALRSLRGSPGFTTVAIVVLTLGIGSSTAIFSLVDAVVLRGMPFDRADRLVVVGEMDRHIVVPYVGGAAAPNYFEWKAQQHVFTNMAALVLGRGFIVRGDERPEELRAWQCTAGVFDVLHVHPRLGRAFTAQNEIPGHQHVAVISDGLWRRRFGADPHVLGRTINVDSGSWEIIGVMPPDFMNPFIVSRVTDLWVPYAVTEANDKSRDAGRNYYLHVIARLNDGVTVEQARAEMARITANLATRFPRWFVDRESVVMSLQEATVGRVRAWMLMLLASVGLVLLIACVNVANLLLARATTRSHEIGIRAALGASRWQVARGLLIESLMLSLAGTLCALLAASWGIRVLRGALPASLPRLAAVSLDMRVLSAAAFAAVITGLLFGLLPALQVSRPNLSHVLGDSGRSHMAGRDRQRLRSSLVIAEVALAVVLLVGAGLFVSSFVRLISVDLGLDYHHVLTVGVNPRLDSADQRSWDRARTDTPRLVRDVLDRVRAIPGVQVVAAVEGGTPLSGSSQTDTITVPGRPPFTGDADQVFIHQVTPEYAEVVRLPIRRGRYLAASDVTGTPLVVVLSEEAVQRFFSGRDPLGAVVQLDGASRQVVGVVGNVRHGGPDTPVEPEAYFPFAQASTIGAEVMIRTRSDSASVSLAVRQAVQASLPDVPVADPVTLETTLGLIVAQRKFNMLLLGLFGALAIMIAAAGIYGVMAYIVAQRVKEIGLRMALGALPREVLSMVLGRALALISVGLAIGVLLSWMVAGSVKTFLFDVQPHDPLVYVSVGLFLLAAGVLAAFVPARRAARVDPMVALRAD